MKEKKNVFEISLPNFYPLMMLSEQYTCKELKQQHFLQYSFRGEWSGEEFKKVAREIKGGTTT